MNGNKEAERNVGQLETNIVKTMSVLAKKVRDPCGSKLHMRVSRGLYETEQQLMFHVSEDTESEFEDVFILMNFSLRDCGEMSALVE